MANILVENVHKVYTLGKTEVNALRGINLEIKKSEFIGIIGPSGSGKTTLLNIIGCIDIPTEGQIFIDGQNTTNLNDDNLTLLRRKYIGFIFQSFNLIPVLNAFENVELPLIAQGVDINTRNKMVIEIMKHMNETLQTTFVISTHDPRLLEYIDKKIFLSDGKIIKTEQN